MSTPLPPHAPETVRHDTTNEVPPATAWLSPVGSIFAETREHKVKRAAGATIGSIAAHALLIGIATFMVTRPRPTPIVEDREPLSTLVFLEAVPGPGGGGGGSPEPAPPKPVVIPRTEAPPPIPIPVVPPPPVVAQPPPPTLSVPVMTTNADTAQATGASTVSLAAYGGGGRGAGLGAGSGDGVGPGTGTGFGGGIARPGSGVNNPRILREQRPGYTSEAMRAKIQGNVELEVVVLADGSVGDVRVTKSLDRVYGLDQEAIKAAKRWQFVPATDRSGQPVPIVVTLVLTFTIH
jgi:periplasmic protein TonB